MDALIYVYEKKIVLNYFKEELKKIISFRAYNQGRDLYIEEVNLYSFFTVKQTS